MYAKTAYHMHANKFRIICTRKLRIICTPKMRVAYKRQSPFLRINTTSFRVFFWRNIIRIFMRPGSKWQEMEEENKIEDILREKGMKRNRFKALFMFLENTGLIRGI